MHFSFLEGYFRGWERQKQKHSQLIELNKLKKAKAFTADKDKAEAN